MASEQQITYLFSSSSCRDYNFIHLDLQHLTFYRVSLNNYGDSIDDPMPAVKVESVTIHQGRFTLQQTELDQLQRTVDPLQQSDNHGIDLYLSDWNICILWVIHSMICIL